MRRSRPSTRRSVLRIAALVVALAVPAAGAAATWSQSGFGAARTAHPPFAGPQTNDTAFQVRLPGTMDLVFFGGFWSDPVIVDGHVYAPVRPHETVEALDGQGVARVDLVTGEAGLFIETDRPPQQLASHDGRLFVTREGGIDAYDLETGELAWSAEHPRPAVEHAGSTCFAPAVRDGTLVTVCTELDSAGNPRGVPVRGIPIVWALDPTTGEERWNRALEAGSEPAPDPQETDDPGDEAPHPANLRAGIGISLVGDYALALTFEQGGTSTRCRWDDPATGCAGVSEVQLSLWGLDVTSEGQVLWRNTTGPYSGNWAQARSPPTGTVFENDVDPVPPTAPRVTGGPDGIAYAKFGGQLLAINPAQGRVLWKEPIGREDVAGGVRGASSAFADGALFVASTQSVYRFDVDVPVERWRDPVDPTLEETTSWGTLMVADGTLYAMTTGDEYGAVYAFDTEGGDRLWRAQLDPTTDRWQRTHGVPYAYALGVGVLVAQGVDGWLHVIGETPASIEPRAEPSTTYPDVGETVHVDLAGTGPGVHGDATRFRAAWGDGTSTGWQNGSVLTHTYTERGDVTATFVAGNDANQTASTTQTFRVGEDPPTEPNLLQTAFAPQHQDLTFGVIGIALALSGGIVGVAKRHKKRARLEDELEALEDGFEETRDNPGECEAFLETRKGRARSLLMDGDLDQEQFRVIEGRVEELQRKLRTGVLDTRFQFLPHGMVESMKRMLADGRISAWERDTLEELLEDDDTLNEAQRERVWRLLDRWGEGGE